MRSITRTTLISCLPAIAGCVAFIPVAEFMPATTEGMILASNCMGAKSVRYNFDGVPVWVSLSDSGADHPPTRLAMGLTLAEGRVARIRIPEIRIKPLDERPEQSFPLPAWERRVLRRVKPKAIGSNP